MPVYGSWLVFLLAGVIALVAAHLLDERERPDRGLRGKRRREEQT